MLLSSHIHINIYIFLANQPSLKYDASPNLFLLILPRLSQIKLVCPSLPRKGKKVLSRVENYWFGCAPCAKNMLYDWSMSIRVYLILENSWARLPQTVFTLKQVGFKIFPYYVLAHQRLGYSLPNGVWDSNRGETECKSYPLYL